MYRIERVIAGDAPRYLGALTELLCDAVENGASVGFLRPLDMTDAQAYWDGVLPMMTSGEQVLLVAPDGGRPSGACSIERDLPVPQGILQSGIFPTTTVTS